MSRTPEAKRLAAMEQIKARGAAFVLTRTPKAYDSSTSRMEQGAEQRWDGWAADWEFDRMNVVAMTRHDDVRLIVAAEGMTDPEPNDSATYAGVSYRVVSAKPIRQAGVSIAYDVHLTRR